MKKKKILLILLIIILPFVIVNYLKFDEKKVSIDIFGVENNVPDISINYKNNLYLCKSEQIEKEYKNGESISFVCEFKYLRSLQHTFEYEINSLYSNKDSVMTLIAQWNQRGINNIAYILKLKNGNEGSTYYTITLENDGAKGYVDWFIFYDAKENKYVSITNKQVKEIFNYVAIVNFNTFEMKETVDFYINELGYEIIYKNRNFIPDISE